MTEGVNQRNAAALHDALRVERRRVDEAHAKIGGLENAIVTIRAELDTLRCLVHASRGTGPSVRAAP